MIVHDASGLQRNATLPSSIDLWSIAILPHCALFSVLSQPSPDRDGDKCTSCSSIRRNAFCDVAYLMFRVSPKEVSRF
jgi:hypothetical protein